MGERIAYVLAAPGWHAGVIGIVASKIVERHHRPTIMLALDPGDPGDHLVTYGGHRAAAGLSIRPAQIPAFRQAFERHAEQLLTPDLLAITERVDAVVSGADLSLSLAEEL